MASGTIERFDRERGFACIRQDGDGAQTLLCSPHAAAFDGVLFPGRKGEGDIVETDRGPEAVKFS